jgi:hypothetical protein
MDIKIKIFFFLSFFLLFGGCANKNIHLEPSRKIAIEGIDKKEFCQKDYSTGYIGGCGGSIFEGMIVGSAIEGYFNIAAIEIGGLYIVYKIADYNKKPIELEYVLTKNKFKKILFLIDKYLKIYLPKNYVSVNNLKFPEIKKPEFYYKKIEKFAKLNNLSYTVFIYFNIKKDNTKIEWDIYDKKRSLQKVINTKCPTYDLKICVKKFVEKIKQ